MNTGLIISKSAEYFRNKTAIIDGEKRFGFSAVNERVNGLANGLLDLGVNKNSKVAALNRNCHQHVEITFALAKIGAAIVSINPRFTQEEVAWQLNDSTADTFIMEGEAINTVTSIKPQLKFVKNIICHDEFPGAISYEQLIKDSSKDEVTLDVNEDDLSSIIYTSGTTGLPKGIMISHKSQLSVTRNLLLDNVPDLNESDVYMALQPLYTAGGVYTMPCWIRGATQVIVPNFDVELAYKMVEKERVTVIKIVPTLLQRFVENPKRSDFDLSTLRTMIYGGSPMPKEKLKEALAVFGPIFVQNYGQSEAPMTCLILNKKDHLNEKKLEAAGRPYTMVECKIVDDDNRDVPKGELGELIIRADHIMQGYWNRPPELTQETLKSGWIYTRDIAKADDEGFVYLVDRKSDMIVSGGYNVYPNEVEQVLYEHQAVNEAAVIGVPDPKWGEAVKGIVVIKEGFHTTENELIEFCKSRLAGYKAPKSFDFKDSLPKNETGKILRRVVKEPYWKGHERRIH